MSEQTVFIKRFPEQRQFPKESGEYDTSVGQAKFKSNLGTWAYTDHPDERRQPKYWYEEVPLSSLLPEIVMPTYDIMSDILDGVDHYGTTDTTKRIFKEIKSLNPSLFPSTTKTDKDE